MIHLLLASALSGLPPSEAALKAYDMACNQGELHLDPSEGKIVPSDYLGTRYPFSLWGTPQTTTEIDLTYPKGTYIMIATYRPKFAQQMKTVCVVTSKSIKPEDAARGFLSGAQNGQITRDLNPARPGPMEIDRPKEGYRKSLIFGAHNTVMLETDLYKEPH
jgi:hypothetical protein